MQKHNLLKTADAYVQQIANDYLPRAQFAFEQTLSDSVTLKTIYSDDVDLFGHFGVTHRFHDGTNPAKIEDSIRLRVDHYLPKRRVVDKIAFNYLSIGCITPELICIGTRLY